MTDEKIYWMLKYRELNDYEHDEREFIKTNEP